MKKSIVLFVLFFSVSLWGQTKDIGMEIRSIMDRYDAVGLSAVVVKDNRVIYSESFGYNPDYNAPELRRPIRNDGVYWLASVSKTFISTAIMQLVEKGKIRLDGDINNYLGFKVNNPKYPTVPITVRMLLSHRSSLNDDQYGWSLDKFIQGCNEGKPGSFNDYAPGAKYDYCNLGYSLLGAIIENVTGKRFDVYIDSKIIAPLRLYGSYNLTKIDRNRLVRAYNYDTKSQSFKGSPSVYNYSSVENSLKDYRLGYSTASLSPAGGMRMSAEDLSRFLRVFMNNGRVGWRRILRKESIQEMITPQGPDNNYGFALTTYPTIISGHNLIGMRGGSHGIHSIMVYDPEERFGFVLISNGYNTTAENGSDMNYRIIRALYNSLIK